MLLWAIPIHRAPSRVVVDLDGNVRVYKRWVHGAQDGVLYLPDEVRVFTLDRSGAEREGYRVAISPDLKRLTNWTAPVRLQRVTGSIYRLEWGSFHLVDEVYHADSEGLSPVLQEEVVVNYVPRLIP